MTASTGWTRKTGQSGEYLGTLSVSSKKGATLKASNAQVREIGEMEKLIADLEAKPTPANASDLPPRAPR